MRNSINSSIANVIRRYRAAAVDMLLMDTNSTSIQWHSPICAEVQPAGNAHQSRYGRLLTNVVVNGIGQLKPTNLPLTEILSRVNERLFVETTFGNRQQCPVTLGNSGTGTVS
jgi:hypothetical protein